MKKQINVLMDSETYERLRERAFKDRKQLAVCVRDMLKEALKNANQGN